MSFFSPIAAEAPGLHESMPETREISLVDGETSFFDQLVDIINPLQHIPVVSTIYRAVSGDEISTPARLIGGALFGGPVGFASTVGNLIFEEATGDDLAGHALALVSGEEAEPEVASTQIASAAANEPAASFAEATSDSTADIIWNGPRVLPSLSSANPDQIGAATPPTPALALAEDQPLPNPLAADPLPANATRPAWLDSAIADAQAIQGAAEAGASAGKVNGQPWLSEAMLEGLRKYRELSLERRQVQGAQ